MIIFSKLWENWEAIVFIALAVWFVVPAIGCFVMKIVAFYWEMQDQTNASNKAKATKWSWRFLFCEVVFAHSIAAFIIYFICLIVSIKYEIAAFLIFIVLACGLVWSIKVEMNDRRNKVNSDEKIKKIVQEWLNEKYGQQPFVYDFLLWNKKFGKWLISYSPKIPPAVKLDLKGKIEIILPIGSDIEIHNNPTDDNLLTRIQEATGGMVKNFTIVTWNGPLYDVFSKL